MNTFISINSQRYSSSKVLCVSHDYCSMWQMFSPRILTALAFKVFPQFLAWGNVNFFSLPGDYGQTPTDRERGANLGLQESQSSTRHRLRDSLQPAHPRWRHAHKLVGGLLVTSLKQLTHSHWACDPDWTPADVSVIQTSVRPKGKLSCQH